MLRRLIPIFTLILVIFAVSCGGEELPTVRESDVPLRQEVGEEWVFNVYGTYIGLVSPAKPLGESVTIPETLAELPVLKLEDGFLAGEGGVVELTIPDSVAYVGRSALVGTKWLAMQDDEYVTVGDGVLLAYNGDETELELPRRIRMLSSAFEGSSVTKITLPDSVESLAAGAFSGCSELTSLNLPDDCEVGRFAFEGCEKLTLTVTEGSSAMRYALERDLPYSFDGRTPADSSGIPSLEPYGELELDYNGVATKFTTDETNAFPSGSGKLAICLGENGHFTRLLIADLRTARVLSEQVIDAALVLTALGREDDGSYSVDVYFKPQRWEDEGFAVVVSAEISTPELTETVTFSCRREEKRERTVTFSPTVTSESPAQGSYLDGYVQIAATDSREATLYAKATDKVDATELLLDWKYGAITFAPESMSLIGRTTLELADVDGDGRDDVVLIYAASSGARVLEERAEVFFGPTGARHSSLDPTSDAKNLVAELPEGLTLGGYTRVRLYGDRIAACVGTREQNGDISEVSAVLDYSYRSSLEVEGVSTLGEGHALHFGETRSLGSGELVFLSDTRMLFVRDGSATPLTRRSRTPISTLTLSEPDLDGDGASDLLLTLPGGRELIASLSSGGEASLSTDEILARFSFAETEDGIRLDSTLSGESWLIGRDIKLELGEDATPRLYGRLKTDGESFICEIEIADENSYPSEQILVASYDSKSGRLDSLELVRREISELSSDGLDFAAPTGRTKIALSDSEISLYLDEGELVGIASGERLFRLGEPIPYAALAAGELVCAGESGALRLADEVRVVTPDGLVSLEDGERYEFSSRDGELFCTETRESDPLELLRRLTGRTMIVKIAGNAAIRDGELTLESPSLTTAAELYDLDAELEHCRDEFPGIGSIPELIASNLGAELVTLESFGQTENLASEKSDGSFYVIAGDIECILALEAKQISLIELTAEGRSFRLAEPLKLYGERETELLEVDGMTALTVTALDETVTLILAREAELLLHERDGESPTRTRLEAADGELRCTRYNAKYTGDILTALQSITSRDELFSESGCVVVTGGEIAFELEETRTIGEAHDLDALFEEHRSSHFPGFATLDGLIGYNVEREALAEQGEPTEATE